MQLSVIIAGNGSGTPIKRCLDSLLAQADGGVRIIVVFGGHSALAQELAAYVSRIDMVQYPAPAALHVLRAVALVKASGEVVAILDPYSIPANDWVAAVRQTHRAHRNQAIGGPVDLDGAAKRGLLDWAIYINEYGMFLPPMEEQGMELLPGCNVSYKRTALFENDAPRSPGLWKPFVIVRVVRVGESRLDEPKGMVGGE
jgi:glycosyltransferase involved in cell wall biosynthesis